MLDEDAEGVGQVGKRLRRVACTCPNCKEAGGRWGTYLDLHIFYIFIYFSHLSYMKPIMVHKRWVDSTLMTCVFCIEAQVWARKSSIFVTSLAVERYTGKPLTCVLICAGTLVKGLLSARGASVAKDSLAATSFSAIAEHTQVLHHMIYTTLWLKNEAAYFKFAYVVNWFYRAVVK